MRWSSPGPADHRDAGDAGVGIDRREELPLAPLIWRRTGWVLAAAGNVDHEVVVRIAESRFRGLRPGPPVEEASPVPVPTRRELLERDTQQTHLVLGVEGVAMSDPRRYALRLLDIILGRGASSRLHRALRGERGLVYAVSSTAMSYVDRGYLALNTSCAPESARTVAEVMFDELDRIKWERVPEAELARAKVIYEGSLARNFETVLSLASIIGIEELLYRIEPFPESVTRIRTVSAEEVQRIAAETLRPEQFAIAVVGRRPSDVRGELVRRQMVDETQTEEIAQACPGDTGGDDRI